jgi:hypothetical protein
MTSLENFPDEVRTVLWFRYNKITEEQIRATGVVVDKLVL